MSFTQIALQTITLFFWALRTGSGVVDAIKKQTINHFDSQLKPLSLLIPVTKRQLIN